jgi:hypothetical protein
VNFPEDGALAEELLGRLERALRVEKAQSERRKSSRPPAARTQTS